jgi:hypothetical protein
MSTLQHQSKLTLDENRMFVLIVEVLIGFQFQGAFQPGFSRLSSSSLEIHVLAALLLLLTLALLLSIPSLHHCAGESRNEMAFVRTSTSIMNWTLLPFAISISLTLNEVAGVVLAGRNSLYMGIAGGFSALLCWYGIPLIKRKALRHSHLMKHTRSVRLPLADRIDEALTECRIILPGTQTILGFQFISFLSDAFERLPQGFKILHLVALCFILVSAILLMTAPAYHRLAENGNDSESFYRLVCLLLLLALAFLGIGISLDFMLLTRLAGASGSLPMLAGGGVLVLFAGSWFVLPRIKW